MAIDITTITFNSDELKVKEPTIDDGSVNKSQLDLKINISDIIDNLTSSDTNKPLSAKQGKILAENVSESLESYINYVNTNYFDQMRGTLTASNTFGVTAGSFSELVGRFQGSDNNSFYFSADAASGKNITVEYASAVWVDKWQMILDRVATITFTVKFQASDDGTTWVDIGSDIGTLFHSTVLENTINADGNKLYKWNFVNQATKTQNYKYWRLAASAGNTTTNPYVYRLQSTLSKV